MTTPKKPLPNYLVVKINTDYYHKLVLPYKEGIAMLATLENAKVYSSEYGKDTLVKDLDNGFIESSVLGGQEYGEAILRGSLLSE